MVVWWVDVLYYHGTVSCSCSCSTYVVSGFGWDVVGEVVEAGWGEV
jgi:hypothetical protein